MAMLALPTEWTVDMVRALPDDGNRYEVIDGELFVTPAPSVAHQVAVLELACLVGPCSQDHGFSPSPTGDGREARVAACVDGGYAQLPRRWGVGTNVASRSSMIRTRCTLGRALGPIVALTACGGDGATPPRTTATSLAFTSQPAEALDGVPLSVPLRVTALDANGKPATAPIEITIDATSPRGAVSLTGTRVASTRNGIATFPELAVAGAGREVTLTAKATALTAITS